MMLYTFQKAFSQASISQWYFPKWQLLKCTISQAATSQVWPSRECSVPVKACGASEGLTWPLGSCCLGNCTFWKLPLGKSPLGKYLWESTKHQNYGMLNVLNKLNFVLAQTNWLQIGHLPSFDLWFNQFYPLKIHCSEVKTCV